MSISRRRFLKASALERRLAHASLERSFVADPGSAANVGDPRPGGHKQIPDATGHSPGHARTDQKKRARSRGLSTTTRSRSGNSSSRYSPHLIRRRRSGATARVEPPGQRSISRLSRSRASAGRPVRVKWINDLVDARPGTSCRTCWPSIQRCTGPTRRAGSDGRDMRPKFTHHTGPYTGPVPIVTHLHGRPVIGEESDGYAEAWYLPKARTSPRDTRRWAHATMSSGTSLNEPSVGRWKGPARAIFQYPNDRRAATLWYHDHTLGMTRRMSTPAQQASTWCGAASCATPPRATPLCLARPRPGRPAGTRYYEIPIAIQDRRFNADGSLFYPAPSVLRRRYGGPLHSRQ